MKILRLSGILSLVFLFVASTNVWAQDDAPPPTLPEFNAITKDGINILSFTNPYESGVKLIAVQRSADSNYNFTTIGTVPKITKGSAVYVDPHPMVGKNWYRIVLVFSSGIDFKSNLGVLDVDSSAIARQKLMPSSEELQKIVNQGNESSKQIIKTVEKQAEAVSYPKSRYVFTNPFSGNINIELPDALSARYTIDFFDASKKKVLNIPRVNEKIIILDKRNFNQLGVYQFTIYKDQKEFEKGYITIF
ncbi:hypothetical protein DBR32_14285 [Taibaiella sp. KBW10]|uniref:hypothetical protein n=1 Tax=Taibaiella sp. KBW10 TaxID=2153357 RepID=UPI000F5975A4|nr:hypothetical protein [Taibaiella sp. KBW10]RQO29750.1 hypothetical protein DBR32_14285 [Taibaiella sp. KBW10]